MDKKTPPTISRRNYRAVIFLFAWSSAVLFGVLLFVFWQEPIVDFAILIIIADLVFMLTLIMWFRRRYPLSVRYD